MCRSPSVRQPKQSPVISSYHFGRILLSCTLSRERSNMPVVLFPGLCRFLFQLMYSWICLWQYCFRQGSIGMYGGFSLEIHFSLWWLCVLHTNLMGGRVYLTTVIFNNSQENHVVAINLYSLLWKEFFCKMKSKI